MRDCNLTLTLQYGVSLNSMVLEYGAVVAQNNKTAFKGDFVNVSGHSVSCDISQYCVLSIYMCLSFCRIKLEFCCYVSQSLTLMRMCALSGA